MWDPLNILFPKTPINGLKTACSQWIIATSIEGSQPFPFRFQTVMPLVSYYTAKWNRWDGSIYQ